MVNIMPHNCARDVNLQDFHAVKGHLHICTHVIYSYTSHPKPYETLLMAHVKTRLKKECLSPFCVWQRHIEGQQLTCPLSRIDSCGTIRESLVPVEEPFDGYKIESLKTLLKLFSGATKRPNGTELGVGGGVERITPCLPENSLLVTVSL